MFKKLYRVFLLYGLYGGRRALSLLRMLSLSSLHWEDCYSCLQLIIATSSIRCSRAMACMCSLVVLYGDPRDPAKYWGQWRRFPMARGHVHMHFYKWLGTGVTWVEKQQIRNWRKRSPKLLIVLVAPQKWRGTTLSPTFNSFWCHWFAENTRMENAALEMREGKCGKRWKAKRKEQSVVSLVSWHISEAELSREARAQRVRRKSVSYVLDNVDYGSVVGSVSVALTLIRSIQECRFYCPQC